MLRAAHRRGERAAAIECRQADRDRYLRAILTTAVITVHGPGQRREYWRTSCCASLFSGLAGGAA